MYFELLGLQSTDAPTVVMSSGLGGSAHFWQKQLDILKPDYRVIVYDQLGTGRSPASLSADYSIQMMADELLSLLGDIEVKHCHFVGHALGGLVGLQIALQQPQLLQSLVLINAWASPNPHTLRCFNIRKAILLQCSADIYLQTQALLLYPPDWIVDNLALLENEERHLFQRFPDKSNLLARIHALSEFDVESKLNTIDVETLVLANKDDMLVPWQRSAVLAGAMPKAKLHLLDYGGHACTVTMSEVFNALLVAHLANFTKAKSL